MVKSKQLRRTNSKKSKKHSSKKISYRKKAMKNVNRVTSKNAKKNTGNKKSKNTKRGRKKNNGPTLFEMGIEAVPYCGSAELKDGQRHGSMLECHQKNQIRYWGINKIDRNILKTKKPVQSNEKKRKALLTQVDKDRVALQKIIGRMELDEIRLEKAESNLRIEKRKNTNKDKINELTETVKTLKERLANDAKAKDEVFYKIKDTLAESRKLAPKKT